MTPMPVGAKKTKHLRLNRLGLVRRLDIDLHEGQRAVFSSPARIRVASAGRKWGKSLLSALEAVAGAMQPASSSLGWLVVPGQEHADLSFARVLRLVEGGLEHRIVHVDPRERGLDLVNLAGGISRIEIKAANHSALLADELNWVVIDDAVEVRAECWEHVRGLLMRERSRALVVSRPRGTGSWFAGLFEEAKQEGSELECWNRPSWDNPCVRPDYVERERRRLPAAVFEGELGGQVVHELGVHCPACGWPEAYTGAPLVLIGRQAVNRCPACNRLVDKDGKVIADVGALGEPTCQLVVVQVPEVPAAQS